LYHQQKENKEDYNPEDLMDNIDWDEENSYEDNELDEYNRLAKKKKIQNQVKKNRISL